MRTRQAAFISRPILQFLCLAVLVTCQLQPFPASAQVSEQAPKPPREGCLQQYGDTLYAVYVCDPTTSEPADVHVLFAMRTAKSGRAAVRAVWKGPATELGQKIAALVDQDRKENASCEVYFHVAGSVGEELQWNFVTDEMRSWWRQVGRSTHRSLCYTTVPLEADYVLAWGDRVSRVTFNYVVPVPQTSFSTGTATVWSGGQMGTGTYTGTTTTNRLETRQGARATLNVLMVVYPIEEVSPGEVQLGSMTFRTSKVGEWRWSKPDKDALAECLEYLAKGAPVGLK